MEAGLYAGRRPLAHHRLVPGAVEVVDKAGELRGRILDLVGEYFAEAFPPHQFVPGVTPIPVAGRVFDQSELKSLTDSALDFWLTAGRFAEQFEREFARFIGVRCATLVNSRSSANLLALSALTSHRPQDRQLQPRDEIITVAAGFPPTLKPLIPNNPLPAV